VRRNMSKSAGAMNRKKVSESRPCLIVNIFSSSNG
jgi:hypothetical protein